ncbi:hydroxyacylglutathione hydrolase [Ventosimonas gracilis]|uniref:Hydroxyacylglutathione hydrolase n=1 Tax=Ventosimonas gracilis TaxID=1680762 RepID=A0A139SW94_9GAMM|nr:hydroxyacylglutathione hydrolase [Ventosimonas gracilis]KXU38848.1 hydroxyacylglutathione hydrolase [Ventosimonas gracilis]
MITLSPLPAFTDNYLWLLQNHAQKQCAVVDPGDAAPASDWLAAHNGWQLTDILITHHHGDHIGGVKRLKQATNARVFGPANESIPDCDQRLTGGEVITVLGLELQILAVPGHTRGHIAYYHEDKQRPSLFCGDTLFAAGCGRIFEGTVEQMYQSLMQLAALPDNTAVYCAHEYTLSNLRFAAAAEPNNLHIKQRLAEVMDLREKGGISLPSTLAIERQTNPFLRCHLPALAEPLPIKDKTPQAVFAYLRHWKNTF